MGDTDPLFELRNLFLIGNFQAAINEGLTLTSLGTNTPVAIERDVLVYRSYVAKGDYSLVLSEIPEAPGTVPALVAVRALARYLAQERDRDAVVELAKGAWPADPKMAGDETVQLVSGLLHFYEEDYDEVFRVLHQSRSLEAYALPPPTPPPPSSPLAPSFSPLLSPHCARSADDGELLRGDSDSGVRSMRCGADSSSGEGCSSFWP